MALFIYFVCNYRKRDVDASPHSQTFHFFQASVHAEEEFIISLWWFFPGHCLIPSHENVAAIVRVKYS